ncbi:MAG: glycosyltransferase family 2 protein [Deltaproteobacteria bacterium CG07_land_8_20_14_0_80_38_7]|nr:MAG: glycosyltransferase family 2 protein [Deltaproteobacteria bacterium CG07_land_8_20_14_0_80_38_7]
MIKEKTIGVVVPAYNEERLISKVISTMPDFVDKIVVVDDKSTDNTVKEASKFKNNPRFSDRIILIELSRNQGVGAAIAEGYKWARDNKIDVAAVMAGDGQMNPDELINIVMPVVNDEVDYVKGNRLLTENSWTNIPRIRFIGNAILSFLTKIASGYWSVMDSQTGYTAISLRALETLNLGKIYPRYGVPNDILVKLNIHDFRIAQIPIKPVYNIGEKSNLKPWKVVFSISYLLVRLFFYRLFFKYVVRDFHPIFLFYCAGFLFFLVGFIGGFIILILDILIALHVLADMNISFGWMLFFTILFLSGLNMLFFGMWMDRDENKNLQINILPAGR